MLSRSLLIIPSLAILCGHILLRGAIWLDLPCKITDKRRGLVIKAGFVSLNMATAGLKITCNSHSVWFVFFRCVQSVPTCRGGIHSRKVGILFNTLTCGTNLNMTHMWWVSSCETLGSLISNDDDDDDTKNNAYWKKDSFYFQVLQLSRSVPSVHLLV